MGCPGRPQVNRSLLLVKAAYFFTQAGAGSLLMYVILYMKQKGLTPSEIAIISGATPFLTAPLQTAVGLLADKLGKHRLVLIVCSLLTSVFMGCMLIVPSVEPASADIHIPVDLICSPNGSFFRYCSTEGSDQSSCMQRYWDKLAKSVSGMNAADLDGNGTNRECHVSCEANITSFAMPICISSDTDMVQICLTDIANISFHLDKLLVEYEHGINSSDKRNDRCGSHTTEFELHNMSVFQDDSASQSSLVYNHISCASASPVTCQLSCPEMFRSVNCEATRIPFNRMFFVFALLYFLGRSIIDAGTSLLDACTYSQLGDDREKFGTQFLWGTIGFVSLGFISGCIMDAVSENRESIDYTWAFVLYIIFNLVAVVVFFFYNVSDNAHCSTSFKKVCKVIRNGEVACLLLVSLVFGMIWGVYEVFLFWHLQTLGASQVLLGLCIVMSSPAEVFLFFFAGRLIKLIGEPVCLYLVCFAFAVQFLGYSFLSNPWWVLAIEPMSGFIFALMHAAATSHGSRLTPPGMHGLMQGLIAAANCGIGKGLGSLAAGPVIELYGAAITFQACAALAVVTFAIYLPAQLWFSRRARRCQEEDKEGEGASPEETKMMPGQEDDVLPKVRDDTDV